MCCYDYCKTEKITSSRDASIWERESCQSFLWTCQSPSSSSWSTHKRVHVFFGCVLGASEQPFPRLQKIRHARLIDHTGDWFYCATARMKYALMICSGCSETYQYYDMPFCSPTDVKHKSEDLGEVLEGDRMVTTLYNVTFKTNKTSEKLCSMKLNPKDISKFKTAVEQDYYFQVLQSSFLSSCF